MLNAWVSLPGWPLSLFVFRTRKIIVQKRNWKEQKQSILVSSLCNTKQHNSRAQYARRPGSFQPWAAFLRNRARFEERTIFLRTIPPPNHPQFEEKSAMGNIMHVHFHEVVKLPRFPTTKPLAHPPSAPAVSANSSRAAHRRTTHWQAHPPLLYEFQQV